MSIRNLVALAAALLTSSAVAANAAGIGVNVGPVGAGVGLGNGVSAGVNVGPLGAGVGIGGTAGFAAPTLLNGAQFIGGNGMLMPLEQSAVINAGITAEGLATGGNLLGITRLPQGTELVTGAPLGETAIILPGMVGMPSLGGCNVSVIGPQGPSALSLIGTSNFVASLPVGGVSQRTFSRITKTTKVVRNKKIHKRLMRKCSHKRVIRREILK